MTFIFHRTVSLQYSLTLLKYQLDVIISFSSLPSKESVCKYASFPSLSHLGWELDWEGG